MRRAIPALALLWLSGCGAVGEPRSTQAREISDLWRIYFWIAAAVAAVVYTLIVWSIIRYRRRGAEGPPQFRVNTALEITYTLIPMAIVVVLLVLAVRAETRVEAPSDSPVATIRVQAFDWSWRFDYQGTPVSVIGTPDEPPEMVLPAGETVRLLLVSSDVIHSFYVPDFLFKRDAIPGRTTRFDLTVDEPGVYRGQCAEFCGLDHYRMRFSIRAVSPEEFEAWLERAAA